jgi:drug/metabolite transporter (DMT)-like permease
MTAILLALGSSVGYGVSDFLASRVARRVPPVLLVLYSQALQSVVLLAVVAALAGALRSRGRRRLRIEDRALLVPVALVTVLNLSADASLAYAVTLGDLAVVSVLASLAPVITALLAHALTAERPSGPQRAGAALAVLGTLVVSAAQAAA